MQSLQHGIAAQATVFHQQAGDGRVEFTREEVVCLQDVIHGLHMIDMACQVGGQGHGLNSAATDCSLGFGLRNAIRINVGNPVWSSE